MCEYCKEDLNGAPLTRKEAIETSVEECGFMYNNCACGRHVVIPINYCPMCGRKLGNEE